MSADTSTVRINHDLNLCVESEKKHEFSHSKTKLFRVCLQLQENESSDEEEVEPKLKYVRISNDLKRILNKDAVSCIAVHSKVKKRKHKQNKYVNNFHL